MANTLTNLGSAYGALGDVAKARDLLERALAIKEREYGPEHRAVASTLANLGDAYGRLGDVAEQRGLLERALAISRREFGPDHPHSQICTDTLASMSARPPSEGTGSRADRRVRLRSLSAPSARPRRSVA